MKASSQRNQLNSDRKIKEQMDIMAGKIKQLTVNRQRAHSLKEYYRKSLLKSRYKFSKFSINYEEVKRENTALLKDYYILLKRLEEMEKSIIGKYREVPSPDVKEKLDVKG